MNNRPQAEPAAAEAGHGQGAHAEPAKTFVAAQSRNPNFNRSMLVRVGRRVRPWFNRVIAQNSLVPNDPVLDTGLFPWIRRFEDNWQAIRAEVDGLLRHRDAIPPLSEISPDHARIAVDSAWQTFFLYGYGYSVPENRARAPKTSALLDAVPGLNSALFSILAPGAHIPRHTGVNKGILTCHLGLIVPKKREQCRMQVEDQMLSWEEGRAFVFDDAQHHEVWNDTDETRVILLVQFARPLSMPGRVVSRAFLEAVKRTTFVQDARKSLSNWEVAYRRAETDWSDAPR